MEEHATNLLNECMLSNDASSKVNALKQVGEILLYRDPSLLEKYTNELLPFQVDPNASVRRFLSSFAEECCSKHAEQLHVWIPVLSALLEDPQGNVAKKACLSLSSLSNVCLRYINEEGNKPKARVSKQAKDAWTSFLHAKGKLIEKALGKNGQSLQMHAIKFCETIIMAYTSTKKPGKDDEFVASRISPRNSLLKQADMQEEAIQLITRLAGLLDKEQVDGLAGPVLIVLINLLCGVAKNRKDLEHLCLPVLIQLADSGIFKEIDSSSQKASAKHALKTGLESIVKSKTTEHVFWNPKLLEALENLGETDLKRIKREGTKATKGQEDVRQEKRKGDAIQLNEIPSAKKTKLVTSTSPQQQRTLYPRTDQVQLEQILILLAGLATSREYGKIHTFIDNMSPAVLTDVVIHNMRYLTTNLAEAVASGITTESMSTNPLSQLVAAQNVEEVQEDAVQMEEDAEAEAVASDAGALALGKELPSAFVVEPPELLHTPDSVSHLNTEDVAALGRAAVSRILGAQFREKRFEFLKHGILIDLALDEDVGGEGNAQVVLEYALGDWHGRDGHELLVRWLNALFLRFCGNDLKNDAHNLGGKDRLFAVKYDAILSAACEGLRERLSPKDKALSQLLMEVPWITKNAVDVVADICQLDKQNAGVWSVLGLTVLRDLILARPTVRDDALNYVLEFTADLDPAMRSRAIRLTVNILYPLDFLREKIEMFADTLLRTAELKEELMSDSIKQEEMDEDDADWERDEEVPGLELGATKKPKLAELLESRISLFMALCTKKHDLLSRLAESYARVDSFRQEIIGKNVPGLVRTIGQDVDVFLNLLDKLPESGEGFAVRCLYSLCEVGPIVAPLKDAVMRFYEKRGDPQLLPPACSSMSSSEFLQVLPAIVRDLDPIAVANALIIAMGGRPIISLDALGDVTIDSARSCIDPPEILIFLHVLDLEKHDVPLKKVVEACNYCFGLKGVFKPELLAIAIQRLSDETVLPVLLMRTVIQTLSVAPSLKKFIVSDVLPKLVNKRVWTVPQLWQGFIRCCQQTMPESYPALLQLPTPQLQEVLDLSAGLKEALAGYAKKSRLALSSAHRELLGLSR